MKKYLDDILILAGCALIELGTYIVDPIASIFMGGAILITLGVLVGLGAGNHDNS
jgi:hypothetical protein